MDNTKIPVDLFFLTEMLIRDKTHKATLKSQVSSLNTTVFIFYKPT